MYNICHFWGEELLDSGLLGRGKIQEKLQEYIPLFTVLIILRSVCSYKADRPDLLLMPY